MNRKDNRSWPEIVGGRRWIVWFGEECDTHGFRAVGVIEGERGYRRFGEISNAPGSVPPMYVGKTMHEAHSNCVRYNTAEFGYDEQTQMEILGSSMGSADIQVVRDGQTDQCVILRDGDEVLVLEGEQAEELWWKLADAFYNFNCDVFPQEGSLRFPDDKG